MPTSSTPRGRAGQKLSALLIAMTLAAGVVTSCGTSSSTITADPASAAVIAEPDSAQAATSASTDTASTPTDTEDAPAADAPVVTFASKLDVTDDSAAPVTALIIAAAGGSVSVTATDGTVFTLEVPPDALADDTTVIATPVSITGGIIGAAGVYAVRFEPEGLRFLSPAVLHVDAPTPIPSGHALAFSSLSDGADVLVGETAGQESAALVDHFSILVLVDLGLSIRAVVIRTNADNAENRLFDKITLDLAERGAERAAGLSTAKTDLRLQEDMIAYQDTVIIPLAELSDRSCAGLRRVAAKMINYYLVATRNKLAGVTTMVVTMQAQVIAMDKKCEADAIVACKEAHDPEILIRYWIEVYTFKAPAGIIPPGRTITSDRERAKHICGAGYSVTGGGGEIVITGTIEDRAKPFLLSGSFTGGSAVFSYSPADEYTGSYTISGGGSGAVVTGSGAYVIEDGDGDTLTLTQNSSSCVSVSGVCRDTIEVMTLTPK